jgi:hypothetical protein
MIGVVKGVNNVRGHRPGCGGHHADLRYNVDLPLSRMLSENVEGAIFGPSLKIYD